MKNKLSACAIPFKCYAKNSFLEVHAWLHYTVYQYIRTTYVIYVLLLILYTNSTQYILAYNYYNYYYYYYVCFSFVNSVSNHRIHNNEVALIRKRRV